MEKIKYVYAIMNKNGSEINADNYADKCIQGLEGTVTYDISFKNIVAVVSDIKRQQVSIKAELAIDHAKVIERLALHHTVLPMRFGTFIESEEAVQKMLKKYYERFIQSLKNVNQKYEFCLKIFWNHDTYLNKISYNTEAVDRKSRNIVPENSNHAQYLFNKLREHRIEESLLKHVENLIEEINLKLQTLQPKMKLKKMVSKSLILDAVYLLDKDKKEEFIKEINHFNNQHEDLNLLVTGPWAPYSFVDINLT